MKKEILRGILKEKRANMAKGDVLEKSCAICEIIKNSEIFQNAESVMMYLPIKNEVETKTLIKEAFSAGKTVLLPHTENDSIKPVIYSESDDLVQGVYGVCEPKNPKFFFGNPELCIVPGIGFNIHGARIGFGKGCYDRFLKDNHCKKMGIAYSFQITDEFDAEGHDVAMDIIVTEEGLFYCE